MIRSSAEVNLAELDEEAADWCLRLGDEALTLSEREEFEAWMTRPGHGETFERASRLWHDIDLVTDTPEMIGARNRALEAYARANQRRWQPVGGGRLYWSVGAIAAMLVLTFAALASFYVPVRILETGVGERRVVVLDDGSKVSLDGATQVEVRFSADHRELTLLDGRAKFDVAKNPLRPFSVTAGDKTVVATGTSFSVELLRRDVHVLLYEGHVAVLEGVANKTRPEQLRLKRASSPADQQLSPGNELIAPLNGGTATVVAANENGSLSWEAGQLVFDEEPLGMAVERINRDSSTRLVVGDSKAGDIRVTGVFAAGDVDAFLEAVGALYPVQIERDGQKITIGIKKVTR